MQTNSAIEYKMENLLTWIENFYCLTNELYVQTETEWTHDALSIALIKVPSTY